MTKKYEILILRIEPELKARLQQAADFDGTTMSDMVRRLIKQVPVIGRVEDERVIWGNDTKRE